MCNCCCYWLLLILKIMSLIGIYLLISFTVHQFYLPLIRGYYRL